MLILAPLACSDPAAKPAPATDVGSTEVVGGADSATGTPPMGEAVFDTSVLHRVDIEVDGAWLETLEEDHETRVPCTFTFDGATLTDVGIRQKGFLGSSDSLDGKPGFSVKLDEFVAGQELDGLERLLLNNAKEDATFLSEHVGYEAYRAMGQRATFTSHAFVRFNGEAKGLYVVKEPVASDFLARSFGAGNDDGNLYEGVYQPEDQSRGDFVTHPELIELKDEVEEGRSRDDLVQVAAAIDETPDDTFLAEVDARLALDDYVTGLALDIVLGYWDSYAFFLNNYYLYHDPGDDRFHYVPHGMDQLGYYQLGYPMGRLAIRIVEHPVLGPRLEDEVARVRAEWDAEAMIARIDEVEGILHGAGDDLEPRERRDVSQFDAQVDGVRDAVEGIGSP